MLCRSACSFMIHSLFPLLLRHLRAGVSSSKSCGGWVEGRAMRQGPAAAGACSSALGGWPAGTHSAQRGAVLPSAGSRSTLLACQLPVTSDRYTELQGTKAVEALLCLWVCACVCVSVCEWVRVCEHVWVHEHEWVCVCECIHTWLYRGLCPVSNSQCTFIDMDRCVRNTSTHINLWFEYHGLISEIDFFLTLRLRINFN